jgi:hypothetical protein
MDRMKTEEIPIMADSQNIDHAPEDAAEDAAGSSRRSFIKKMVYAAPVIETFLLEGEAKAQNRGNTRNWKPRQTRKISPVPSDAKKSDKKK